MRYISEERDHHHVFVKLLEGVHSISSVALLNVHIDPGRQRLAFMGLLKKTPAAFSPIFSVHVQKVRTALKICCSLDRRIFLNKLVALIFNVVVDFSPLATSLI